MKSQSLEQAEQGGGGGVKRRPLHHHQHPQQRNSSPLLLHHGVSSSDVSSLGAAGEKKRTSTSALERRCIVCFLRLFHQGRSSLSSSSSSRLLAWPILITCMLIPIVIFHTHYLPLSSSSSSSSSLSWPFGLENSRQRTVAVAASTTSQLYGRHYRAVEYNYAVTGDGQATRLVHFYTSNQATENNKDNNNSSSSFDILHHHITEPRGALPEVAPRDGGGAPNKSPIVNNAARQRRLVQPMMTRKQREALQDSSSYREAQPDNWETKRCKAQFAWQKETFMTCNIHHELDMTVLINQNNNNAGKEHDDESDESSLLRLVANGYYRDVWVTNDYNDDDAVTGGLLVYATTHSNQITSSNNNNNKIVLKTLRYEHEFDLRNWDRHRRDAIAMERLSASPFVLDIYASCGNSGLTEYASGGSIKDAIFPTRQPKKTLQQNSKHHEQQEPPKRAASKIERLQMAVQATMGLQALHSIGLGTEGSIGPAISHTDITPEQFVRVGEIYKLNDFNRARFILADLKERQTCPFKISQASGLFRSPEEYDKEPLTEKIDIYSLGNLFYILLTDQWPWDEVGSSSDSEGAAKKRIIHGERPTISDEIAKSSHPVDQVLLQAMAMCQKQDPSERATAAQVATLLQETLQQVDPGRLEQWGVVI